MSDAPCDVVQFSDLTQCRTCRLRWDTNDPFPPDCPRKEREEYNKQHGCEHTVDRASITLTDDVDTTYLDFKCRKCGLSGSVCALPSVEDINWEM